MEKTIVIALLLSIIASLANVLGGFLSVIKKVQLQTLRYFIALSAGFILAVTFLDLFPDVIKELNNGVYYVLIGFVAIFFLENVFITRAHDNKYSHEHSFLDNECHATPLAKKSVIVALLGFLVHTFFDGAAIAARIMVSPIAGFLVFIAVLAHKVPEGFSIASIFQAGRFNRKQAFLAAVSLGASTVIGALVVYLTKKAEFSLVFLALATGSFTYIVTSELVPYVSIGQDKKNIFFFLLGIVLYYVASQGLARFGLG